MNLQPSVLLDPHQVSQEPEAEPTSAVASRIIREFTSLMRSYRKIEMHKLLNIAQFSRSNLFEYMEDRERQGITAGTSENWTLQDDCKEFIRFLRSRRIVSGNISPKVEPLRKRLGPYIRQARRSRRQLDMSAALLPESRDVSSSSSSSSSSDSEEDVDSNNGDILHPNGQEGENETEERAGGVLTRRGRKRKKSLEASSHSAPSGKKQKAALKRRSERLQLRDEELRKRQVDYFNTAEYKEQLKRFEEAKNRPIPKHYQKTLQKHADPTSLVNLQLFTEVPRIKYPKDFVKRNRGKFLFIKDWKDEYSGPLQRPVGAHRLPQVRDLSNLGQFMFAKQLAEQQPLSSLPLADHVCQYDADTLDIEWLDVFNLCDLVEGDTPVGLRELERVMECLENQCEEKINSSIESAAYMGREFDDDEVCTVCGSGVYDADNLIVFCDICDRGYHQGCYGIAFIYDGKWYCDTCEAGISDPECEYCPNYGGAFKQLAATEGNKQVKWAHVNCVLWIPELHFTLRDEMSMVAEYKDPKHQADLARRSKMRCSLCDCKEDRERGLKVQCCRKGCYRAFHVTCAMNAGYECSCDEIRLGTDLDTIDLLIYCKQHSDELREKRGSHVSPLSRKPRNRSLPTFKEMLRNEMNKEFYKFVDFAKFEEFCAQEVLITKEAALKIYYYWKLKRLFMRNKALIQQPQPAWRPKQLEPLPTFSPTEEMLAEFETWRFTWDMGLNLSYLICKREKLKREFLRYLVSSRQSLLELTTQFANDDDDPHKLTDASCSGSLDELKKLAHGSSIYEQWRCR